MNEMLLNEQAGAEGYSSFEGPSRSAGPENTPLVRSDLTALENAPISIVEILPPALLASMR